MNLHEDKELFAEIILRAGQPKELGGLGVNAGFIEKDYWITRSLQQLSRCSSADNAVFKGGTSLSKIFNIGSRFSEDIDIAIVKDDEMSDASLKSVIRTTQKSMSEGLDEIHKPGATSKGSHYRKVYFSYPLVSGLSPIDSLLSGQLLIEINSFANPIPYAQQPVSSFIRDYLIESGNNDIIHEFDLDVFSINVLDKRTTLTEKLVSLMRFSLSENPIADLQSKIRHFYDLYFLSKDTECVEYLNSVQFMDAFKQLLEHDRILFAHPDGWQNKSIVESILLKDLSNTWNSLQNKYMHELPSLAYSDIPSTSDVVNSFEFIISHIRL